MRFTGQWKVSGLMCWKKIWVKEDEKEGSETLDRDDEDGINCCSRV